MSKGKRKILGSVHVAAVALLAVAGLTVLGVSNMPAGNKPARPAAKTLDGHALAAALYLDIVGVSPDAVAAVGLSPQQAATVFADLQAYLDGDGAGLQTVIDTWGTAHRNADMATRALRSGKGSTETVSSLNDALSTAAGNKQSAINAAFSAATAHIDGSVAEVLLRIRNNRAQNVPVQYLLIDRTEEQWRQLRDALSQKRTREEDSRELDEDAASLIADANAEPAVSSAASHVTNNLSAVRAAMQ